MSYDQHNAGMHYIHHSGRKPEEKRTYNLSHELSHSCSKCSHCIFEITKSGNKVRCVYCGALTSIDIHMNLDDHFCFESEKDIYREKAKERQRCLIEKLSPQLPYCYKCGSGLTNDRYCKQCQTWKK